MDTDERLSNLEKQVAKYDQIIQALVRFASKTAKGRLLLLGIGIPRELWP